MVVIYPFHDRGPYPVETSSLICSAKMKFMTFDILYFSFIVVAEGSIISSYLAHFLNLTLKNKTKNKKKSPLKKLFIFSYSLGNGTL